MRERREEERERQAEEIAPEQRIRFPLTREDNIESMREENCVPLMSSPAQPSVRYPSPSILNHVRRPLQSCDNQPDDQSPGDREEETELGSTGSETFLSTTAPSTPDHSTTGIVGTLVTQVGGHLRLRFA